MAQSEASHAIRDVLRRERTLLQAGKTDELTSLLEEKARCLARAPEIRDPEVLRKLQSMAERNQMLLAAAAEG